MKIERTTLNGAQTIRVEGNDQEVKISILKGTHYRGIAKLSNSDASDVAKALTEFLYGTPA